MSCSSCTNSISSPGAASCSLSRRSAMISSAERARSLARLQPHEDVAAVLLRREQPELGPGAALNMTRPPASSAGLLRPSAAGGRSPRARVPGGRQVVDDEAAFVGVRQEAGADEKIAATPRREDEREQQRQRPSGRASAATSARRRASSPARRGCARAIAGVVPDAPARASSGISVSASTSDTSTAAESVSDSARKNWPTTPDSRPSGANTTTVVSVELTTGAMSSAIASRDRRRRSLLHAAMDVLDHDNRIVDDQADRDREAAHRHQVDRLAEEPHDDERRR